MYKKKLDITSYIGKTYGELVILDVYRDQKSRAHALCKCSCGNQTNAFLSNIIAGKTKSCGHLELENRNKYLDIRKQRFGKLIAIEPTKLRDNQGSIMWLCKCDCGNECYRSSRSLVRGYSTHCGCVKVHNQHPYFVDLTGKQIGRLSVIEKTDKRDKKGLVIWRCKCSCGNEVEVSSNNLIQGNTKSCGCLNRESAKEMGKNKTYIDDVCINTLNRKQRKDNKTGHTGVYQNKNGSYRAIITIKKERHYLGCYQTLSKAIEARKQGEEIYHQKYIDKYKKIVKGS